MTPSFSQLLEALNRHQVEYIVVGGVAAVIHGAPMTTFDLDALVRVNQVNAERLVSALTELEARFREHHKLMVPTQQDILAGGHLLLMTQAGPLDILGFIGDHQSYDSLIDHTSEVRLGGWTLKVLALEELIRQKKAMGRPKDLMAAELLEEVLKLRLNDRS